MKEFKNFSLGEFTSSATAVAHHIDNTPSPEVEQHIEELVETILQPLRNAWGSGLQINSGYRCPELNARVGGAATSAHLTGYAADVTPVNGRITEFISFAEKWLKEGKVKFDQSIDERTKHGARWWHISLKGTEGKQRCQCIDLIK